MFFSHFTMTADEALKKQNPLSSGMTADAAVKRKTNCILFLL